jgi:hypothetical protein
LADPRVEPHWRQNSVVDEAARALIRHGRAPTRPSGPARCGERWPGRGRAMTLRMRNLTPMGSGPAMTELMEDPVPVSVK